MYCPAAHEVTAVARPVFAVASQTLVTYCVPLGEEHVVHKDTPLPDCAEAYVPLAHGTHAVLALGRYVPAEHGK